MTTEEIETRQVLVISQVAVAKSMGVSLTLDPAGVTALEALFEAMDEVTVAHFLALGELARLRLERDDLVQRLAESDQHRRDLQVKLHTARKGTV